MECPACTSPMIVVEREKIELDHCINCKGIWFDADELQLLSEALGIAVDLPDINSLPKIEVLEKPRKCPRCLRKMDKIDMGGKRNVVIDRCPAGHGLWFDWGELGQVMEQHIQTGETGEHKIVNFLGETFRY